MAKIAFVFPGQGTQYSGMGKDLVEKVPEASWVFQTADQIRPGTSEECFYGDLELLSQTRNTQPDLFTVELAAAAALGAAGIQADLTAGFSLGELAALTYSGAITLPVAFRLVMLRAELMQQAAEKTASGMGAVLGLEDEEVEKLCALYKNIYPVNYNCPGQISVSGLQGELAEFKQSVKAVGGKFIPLQVGGGFHSPLMLDAGDALGHYLRDILFKEPGIPVYSNYTGLPYTENIRQLLANQVSNPVRWKYLIENMIMAGTGIFIELGPGKTLSKFISRIDPQVKTFQVEDEDSLQKTIEGVKNC